MICLSIATGGDPRPRVVRSELDSMVLGRAEQCDLVLDDTFLSRRHARIFRDGDRLLVEDLGSSNGTLVNGVRISAPTAIVANDLIRMSETEITVLDDEAAPSDPGESRPLPPSTMLLPIEDLLPKQPAGDGKTAGTEALRDYSTRLELLNNLHAALSRSVDLDELLQMILDGAFEHLRPTEGCILLLDPDGTPRVVASRTTESGVEVPISQTLIKEVVERGQGAMVDDTHSDERFAKARSMLLTVPRSIVAAPLHDGEGPLGMISLSASLLERPFREDDLSLLASLASVAALRIRNVSLAEEARERERLETELGIARTVQMSLLPQELPKIPGWEMYAANTPSRGVSGDYYQAITREDGAECLLTVADVCGKGMGAALLTATTEAVSSALAESGSSPPEIFEKTSQFLYHRTTPDKYATAFIAAFRKDSSVVRYVNGGHATPLVLREGDTVDQLAATGFPLGMVPGAEYEAAEIDFAPGDLLVVYTDGITEAEDPAGEELGVDRFIELLQSWRHGPLEAIDQALEAELATFTQGAPSTDDRTLVLLRRAP